MLNEWIEIFIIRNSRIHDQTLGGLAQLARAPALQAGGQRFDSVILHKKLLWKERVTAGRVVFDSVILHKKLSFYTIKYNNEARSNNKVLA